MQGRAEPAPGFPWRCVTRQEKCTHSVPMPSEGLASDKHPTLKLKITRLNPSDRYEWVLSPVQVLVPIVAGPDKSKCLTLSTRVGAIIMVDCTGCESNGAPFTVLRLREQSCDG